MEKVMEEDSVLASVKDVELSFWADETERELYFQYQKYLMDAYSDEHTYEFLLEQERERAERAAQDALKQGKLEMARNLLKRGMDMDEIVQISGLTEEEIQGTSDNF
jgi:predicted transposase/invertase (TIGR01784 family)